MVEHSVHRASHVIRRAHAQSTVTHSHGIRPRLRFVGQPRGLPLALAPEAGRLGDGAASRPDLGRPLAEAAVVCS
jgi:hypothetical protein